MNKINTTLKNVFEKLESKSEVNLINLICIEENSTFKHIYMDFLLNLH